MDKKNKVILSFGSLSATVIPVASVISCGAAGEDYSNVVLLKTGYASSGPQYKAIKAIVDQYNKVKGKDDAKVKLLHIQGGYGTAAPLDSKDIGQHHMNNVSNIFIDYPDAIGRLISEGKQLDISKLGIKRDQFVGSFLDVNDQIQGTNGIAGKQLYFAPVAISSEMLSVDLPVLAHVLKDIVKEGGTVKGLAYDSGTSKYTATVGSTTGVLKDVLSYIAGTSPAGTNNKTDNSVVEKMWKLPTDKTSVVLNDLKINSDTFNSYETLLDFADKVQKSYNPSNDSGQYVMGIDAPTNAMYQAIFAKGGFDYSPDKFVYGIKSDEKGKQAAYYLGLEGKGNAAKDVKAGINLFLDAVNDKGLRFNGSGAFTSSDLTAHRAIISWGSTAGYSHNFKGEMGSTPVYAAGTDKEKKLTSYVKKLVSTKKTGAIAETGDKYHNPVYGSDYGGTLGRHDIKISTPAVTRSIVAALKDNATKDKIYLSSASGIKKDGTDIVKATVGRHPNYFFNPLKISVSTTGAPDSLQKEETSFQPAPSKVGKNDDKTTNMLQGPSFIPVSHNKKIDKETGKFIKWFFDANSKISNGHDKVPVYEYWSDKADYIVPVKGAFDQGKDKGLSISNKITFNSLVGAAKTKGSDKFAFQAPVTRYSGTLRKNVIDPTLKDFWSESAKTGSTKTCEDIYNNIIKLAKSNRIIK